ncbi:MAG TPA: hypothetical protein VEK13_07250 [Thermoplasmata archaeon]|nr:hypothetical protein [Thermoplasmata archaeon]
MTRTQRQIRVPGVGVDQVRAFSLAWLANNGLTVIDEAADGSEKRYPVWGQHLHIHPTQGSLVAVSGKLSGAVVFELLFYPAGPDSVLNVYGYAAGAGPLFRGKEYEFTPSAMAVAGAPRKRGHDLLERFEADLARASVPAYPPYGQPPGQSPTAYYVPGGQPTAPQPATQAPPTPYYPSPELRSPPAPMIIAPGGGSQPAEHAPQPPPASAPPVVEYHALPGQQPTPSALPPRYPSQGQPGWSPQVQPVYPTATQSAPWPQPTTPQPVPAAPAAVPAPIRAPTTGAGPAVPPAPMPALPTCAACGKPATFIPQYGRYYCYSCAQYI